MKFTHKLCGTILLAALATTAVTGTVVAAEPQPDSVMGNNAGQVEFTDATYEAETDNPVPDTDEKDPEKQPNGKFLIRKVTPLDFGKAEASATKEITSFAKTYVPAGNPKAESANYVRFKDDRQVDDHTYQLTAKITKQFEFKDGETLRKLDNATITYGHQRLLDAAENGIQNPGESGLHHDAVVKFGESTPIFTNTGAKGRGDYFIAFGKLGDTAKPGDKAVKLTVPSGTDVRTGTYNATVTWTLSETPLK